jgi:hypothetical protein
VIDVINPLRFEIGITELPPDEPETWWIVGDTYPGAAVSTLGRVHAGRRICKQWSDVLGKSVTLHFNDHGTNVSVQKLVGITFLGRLPAKYIITHLDHNQNNNKISNVRYEVRSVRMKPVAKARKRAIVIIDEHGTRLSFDSRIETAKYLDVSPSVVDISIERKRPILHQNKYWELGYLDGMTKHYRRPPLYPDAEWRPSIQFPDYECSDRGETRRKGSRYAMQPNLSGYYYQLEFRKNGIPRLMLLHRVICESFHGPAPTELHQVNHLNENKLDNRPENLEWTLKNTEYSQGIPCERLLPSGSWEYFPSSRAAAAAINRTPAALRSVFKGRSRTCGGYTWRLADFKK